jgi:AcrR family transcriptional regulator
MPKKKLAPPPARKPRADAQRNRERILEVAKEVFTRDGAAASLDDIARQAGIGPGTLYRHFPTRDALIEAVYRSEVEKLAAAEPRFAAAMPPLEALRAWMLLFIDHVSEKKLIIPAMDTVAGGSMRLIEGARSLIHTAFVASVKRAIASGDLHSDTDPDDFVRALVGIFHTTAIVGWEPSARRLVNILIAGSRSTPRHPFTPLRTRQQQRGVKGKAQEGEEGVTKLVTAPRPARITDDKQRSAWILR